MSVPSTAAPSAPTDPTHAQSGSTPTQAGPEYLDLPEPDGDPTRRLRRRATVWAAVAAPALFIAGSSLSPKLPSKVAEVVPKLPPIADRLLAAHLLVSLASLLFLPFTVALWRIPARRGAALRFAGGLLLMIGMVSNALGETTDAYAAWDGVRSSVDPATQVRLLEKLDSSAAGLPISFLAIPVALLGLVLLTVGVLRSRLVPIWAPIVLLVGLALSGVVSAGPVGAILGLGFVVGAVATVLLADAASSDRS
jgi:hypothetical protein